MNSQVSAVPIMTCIKGVLNIVAFLPLPEMHIPAYILMMVEAGEKHHQNTRSSINYFLAKQRLDYFVNKGTIASLALQVVIFTYKHPNREPTRRC